MTLISFIHVFTFTFECVCLFLVPHNVTYQNEVVRCIFYKLKEEQWTCFRRICTIKSGCYSLSPEIHLVYKHNIQNFHELSGYRVSLILEPLNQVKIFKPLHNYAPDGGFYRKCPLFQKFSGLLHWTCIDSWCKGVINAGAADVIVATIIFPWPDEFEQRYFEFIMS